MYKLSEYSPFSVTDARYPIEVGPMPRIEAIKTRTKAKIRRFKSVSGISGSVIAKSSKKDWLPNG